MSEQPPGPGVEPAAADLSAADLSAADLPAADAAAADASLLALVDRLSAILERSELAELEVEAGGTALVLRAPAPPGPAAAPATAEGSGPGRGPDPGPAGSRADPAAAPGTRGQAPANAILAPLTGVFYASANPGSPPFVAPGREIAVGEVIGLIEAMKLFNEIKSDRAGRVVRLLVENGALVRARQPLVELEPR